MKYLCINFLVVLYLYAQIVLGREQRKNVVCYYDAGSSLITIPGDGKFTGWHVEKALPFCTHLIYGYAGLNPDSYLISILKHDRFDEITAMKLVKPELKVYLSLGGDRDQDFGDGKKYIQFLERGYRTYANFICSSIQFLKSHKFDGLDLAFQFPRNKLENYSKYEQFKNCLQNQAAKEDTTRIHKQQFTEFVQNLHKRYKLHNLALTLTVLPNVNASSYIDIPKIHDKFEYINLFAFDFFTPERSPHKADYTAPIYLKDEQNRLPQHTIDFQVQHWIKNGCPANKLNLGIPTHARAWNTTSSSLMPVISDALGAAAAGSKAQRAGLLTYPEFCLKLLSSGCHKMCENAYGCYATCKDNGNTQYNMWLSYDGPEFAARKADYVMEKGLGGVAIVDISYDDYNYQCQLGVYPILNAIEYVFKNQPNRSL